jgi:hypothetical protein
MLSGCNILVRENPLLIDMEDDGDLYEPPKIPIDEWLQSVKDGMFIDYDGYGCWATENDVSDTIVHPSDITLKGIVPPVWATHVEWYNK